MFKHAVLNVRNVFFVAFPDTNSNPLQPGTTAIEGAPTVVNCTIRSRPKSNITWSHDVEVVAVKSQNVRVDRGYYITTGILNITQPSAQWMERGSVVLVHQCLDHPSFKTAH